MLYFYDGLAVVRGPDKGKDVEYQTYLFGYINHTGAWEIPPMFSCAYPFNGRLAFAGENVSVHNRGGIKGYIDRQGNWIIKWNGY